MAVLSTEPIDNNPVLGVYPSTVRNVNRDLVNSSDPSNIRLYFEWR